MCDLIKDTLKQLKSAPEEKPKMLHRVFEDNQAACELVSNQQLLVQTKCFAVKCHLFWQFVCHVKKSPKGWLTECSTDLMNADHLAGGLAKTKFDAI